jgi:uncharacterized membrane protein
MITDPVRIEKERTKQVRMQTMAEVMKSPLYQALITWLIVEAAQKYGGFGSLSGSVLEGATMVKLMDLDRMIETMGKTTAALAPIIAKTAVLASAG